MTALELARFIKHGSHVCSAMERQSALGSCMQGTGSGCGMACKSAISSAVTTVPACSVVAACRAAQLVQTCFELQAVLSTALKLTAGSSSRALAERMDSRRLLIWPPVLTATSSPPCCLQSTS